MISSYNVKNFNKIHFVGIGGVSMSALAEFCLVNGIKVSGSDIAVSDRTKRLKELGCEISYKHQKKNVCGADAVVHSAALDKLNSEIAYAIKKNIPLFTRGEFLGQVLKEFKTSVAVSGCHGKTTATAMIAHVLISAGIQPTIFLGGESKECANFKFGKSNVVVAEACEYKKSFLSLKPNISVILNVDNDHLDTFKDIDGVKEAFSQFAKNGIAVINADDKNCADISSSAMITFGIEKRANYRAKNLKKKDGCYEFIIETTPSFKKRLKLNIKGKHNVYNALASFAVLDLLKVPRDKIVEHLKTFNGVSRRNEFLGKIDNLTFVADYAHHPKELKAMLEVYKGDEMPIITIFQPHTYSRTKCLMQEFVDVLKDCSPLILYKTYPAREKFDIDGSAYALFQNLKNIKKDSVYYVDDIDVLLKDLKKISTDQEKKVIIFGAGDLYDEIKNRINKV